MQWHSSRFALVAVLSAGAFACSLPTGGLGVADRGETSVTDAAPASSAETSVTTPEDDAGMESDVTTDTAIELGLDASRDAVTAVGESGGSDGTDGTDALDGTSDHGDGECTPIGDELMVNGDFELPAIGRDSTKYSNDGAFLPGFTLHAVGAWNRFWIENGAPGGVTHPRHLDGVQAICLNADGTADDYVEQRFPTVVGARYRLRFALTDEKNAGPSTTAVRVEVAAAVRTFDRKSDDGWQTKTMTFVALGDSTLLRIVDTTPGSAWDHSPFIDAVSIRTCE